MPWCWSLIRIRLGVDQLQNPEPSENSTRLLLVSTSLASYSQLIRNINEWSLHSASRLPSKEMVGKCDCRIKSALITPGPIPWHGLCSPFLLSHLSCITNNQMHLLVCIHARIISQFQTQHSILCVLSCQWNVSCGQRSRKALMTNISDAMHCGWWESHCLGIEWGVGTSYSIY